MSEIERLSETHCDDCNGVFFCDDGDYVLYKDHLKVVESITKSMNAKIKKAFWWSAEFTQTVHCNHINSAWNDYNEIISRRGEGKS